MISGWLDKLMSKDLLAGETAASCLVGGQRARAGGLHFDRPQGMQMRLGCRPGVNDDRTWEAHLAVGRRSAVAKAGPEREVK